MLIELSDELWSGVAVVAAPAVEHDHGLSHASYTLFVFALPLLLSAALEAVLALFIDSVARARFLAFMLALLSASLLLAAWAPSAGWLTLALAIAGAASGAACGAAQAVLIRLDDPERALARWTFYGAVGDVATPLLVGGLAWAGASYRALFAGIAGVVALEAVGFACHVRNWASAGPDGPDELPLRGALRRAASNGRLWAWLFGVACCSLLDELMCALLALRLERELDFGPSVAALAVTAASVGTVAGAALTERLLVARASSRILFASALVSLAALLVATHAESRLMVLAALPLLGAASAAHYPLLMARAYAEAPRAPGVVNAILQVFVVLDIAAPIAIGWLADRLGLRAALSVLGLQPVVVLLLAWLGRASASGPGTRDESG